MSQHSHVNYSPSLGQKSLLRVGGSLGIAAASISLAIFTIGCFGFRAVFTGLPLIPLVLSVPGLVLSIIGATIKKSPTDADTHFLAAIFANFLGFVGALLEMAIWLNWTLLYQQSTK